MIPNDWWKPFAALALLALAVVLIVGIAIGHFM